MQPFYCQTVGLAARAVSELMEDPRTTAAKYPTEYSLFEIGEFDDSNGALVSIVPGINHGLLAKYKPVRDTRQGILPGVESVLEDLGGKVVDDKCVKEVVQ